MPRKARKLDTNRSFGKITGRVDAFPGARYEQDGFYFRSNGTEVLPGDQAGKINEVAELTPAQENEVAEIEEWTNEQKGRDGRLVLEEYASELGMEDPHKLNMGDLRTSIVGAFREQLLQGE